MEAVLLQSFNFGFHPQFLVSKLLFQNTADFTCCEQALLPEAENVTPSPLVYIIEGAIPGIEVRKDINNKYITTN